jgi:hypothetical protein
MATREESLIISEELFRALSPVSGDLDWQYIWPIVLAVDDKWIQPILGQKLYEKIMAEIKAGSITGVYKDLLEDYIARVAVWYSCYMGFPFWGIKVVNSGIIQRVVDDGAVISFNDIDKLAELCRGQAEWYQQRLIDYLCTNSKDFPEYNANTSGEVHSEAVNYSGGLNMEPYTKMKSRGSVYDYISKWL